MFYKIIEDYADAEFCAWRFFLLFTEWDDLIEWEAYELAYKDWQGRYEELKIGKSPTGNLL